MPLIVMCGHPCSGKTTVTEQLMQYIQQQPTPMPVHHLTYETMKLTRSTMYTNKSNVAEKKGTATVRSSVERLLTKDSVVICDMPNQVKGFRYELFTRAKEVGTTYCVVYCQVHDVQLCLQRNAQRQSAKLDAYSTDECIDLCNRLETPDGSKRWDNPLFTVDCSLTDLTVPQATLESIYNFLCHGKAHQPSLATKPQQMEDSNYVSELERITAGIVTHIAQLQQSSAVHSDSIAIPNTDTKLKLTRKVPLPELKRMQRTFLKMMRLRPVQSQQVIATIFVDHINSLI